MLSTRPLADCAPRPRRPIDRRYRAVVAVVAAVADDDVVVVGVVVSIVETDV